MYRPQFPFVSPPDCQDHRCTYSFDKTNTPTFGSIAAGKILNRIPLALDNDAPFIIRGIQIWAIDSAQTFTGDRPLVQIYDSYNNPWINGYRSDGTGFLDTALWGEVDGAGLATLDNCDDWGNYNQAGAKLKAYVQNTTATVLDLYLTFHGVKRYSGSRCA